MSNSKSVLLLPLVPGHHYASLALTLQEACYALSAAVLIMLHLLLSPVVMLSLQLYGNPLEYLPELAPAVGLRSISLANVRILADAAYSR